MDIVRYPPAWQDILDDRERAYETASWEIDTPVIADCPETTARLIWPFVKAFLGIAGTMFAAIGGAVVSVAALGH